MTCIIDYPDQARVLNDEQLRDTALFWIRALGLSDWSIRIERAAHHELGNNYGDCDWTLGRRAAFIRVLDPAQAPIDALPCDMEQTIVHELLHCCFAAIDESAKLRNGTIENDMVLEQPLDHLAKLLVRLRRAGTDARLLPHEHPPQ